MAETTLAPDALLDRFSQQRVLVIGDLMLDWFIWGSVSRISPEAPVPVVEVQSESRYPGGAANVARNITPFEATVELAGIFGNDSNGVLLRDTLADCGIGIGLCLQRDDYQTITKTRVVARHQQVVRIDREKRNPLSDEATGALLAAIEKALPDFDAVIVEDYGKGLVSQKLVDGVLKAAGGDLIVTVDPKPGSPIEWTGATTVKPNRFEAFACAGIEDIHHDAGVPPLEDGPLLEAGRLLLDKWECRDVLLTLGEQGMLVFGAESDPVHIPAKAKEVFDVSGAGDTAIAIYTLGLCSGLTPADAAHISNLASSIVVGKLGTAPIERPELQDLIAKEFPGGISLVD